TKKFRDQHEDSNTAEVGHRPLFDDGKLKTGTYMNYKSVLLQRLANPLAPYNSKTNPYLTVDWMPIDLTVFNGQAKPSGAPDPDDPSPDAIEMHFASRQRGKLTDYATNQTKFNIWSQQSLDPAKTKPVTAGTASELV